jgi:putative lipoprotein
MKQIKIAFTALCAALFAAACSNDNVQNNQEQGKIVDRTRLTAFTMGDEGTRTTADYDGTGISFYWTKDDRLWVNKNTNPMLPADLEQDADNEINAAINGGATKVATSKFYFNGTFTEPEYIVRYTGKNGKKDKVTIATTQAQPNFNDATHLGESGDCGVGKATRNGGKYYFTLQHKAAYLTFIPHTSLLYAYARLTQVKVTAEKAIAGEFNFTDTGIDLASRPAATPANQSITLTLGTSQHMGTLRTRVDSKALIMVVAPGTYSKLTVEYSLYDNFTKQTGVIKKEYANVTLTPGKNQKITPDLVLPILRPYSGQWTQMPANVANLNQAMWYIHRGDPKYDLAYSYVIPYKVIATAPERFIVYTGGLWLLKKDNIPGFSATVAHNGANYTGGVNNYAFPLAEGRPADADISKYFFTPFVIPENQSSHAVPIKDRYKPVKGFRLWTSTTGGAPYHMGEVFAGDLQPTGNDVIPPPNIGIGVNYNTVRMPFLFIQ